VVAAIDTVIDTAVCTMNGSIAVLNPTFRRSRSNLAGGHHEDFGRLVN
jgi:hypothetical protein